MGKEAFSSNSAGEPGGQNGGGPTTSIGPSCQPLEVPTIGEPGLPPEIQGRLDELFANNKEPFSFKHIARVLGYAGANGTFNNGVREVAQELRIEIEEGERACLTPEEVTALCTILKPNPGRRGRPPGKGGSKNAVNGDLPQETDTAGGVTSAPLEDERGLIEEEEKPGEYEDGEYEKGVFTFTKDEIFELAKSMITEDGLRVFKGNKVGLETNDLYEINLIVARMENKTGRANISAYHINDIVTQLRKKLKMFPANKNAFSQQNGDAANVLLKFISRIEKNATSFSFAIEKLLPVLTPRELDLAANSPPALVTEPWRMKTLRAD